MRAGALNLESGAWGLNPRPAATSHPVYLLGLPPSLCNTSQACLRQQDEAVRCKQEFFFLPRMKVTVLYTIKHQAYIKKALWGKGESLGDPIFQHCCNPEEQPTGIFQKPGPTKYRVWHLVEGSYPDSGLGQPRLLKGQHDILQAGRCRILHSHGPEGPKAFQGSGAAGRRDRALREPRDALPDAVARWRSELTLTAPRRGRRVGAANLRAARQGL